MKIEITGSRCITCRTYSQYYSRTWDGGFDPINCGYCGMRQCNTQPGNRCKYYQEKSNIAGGFPVTKGKKYERTENF
ncbi:MAG: hypothetical protein RR614_07910 [Eubacterium sp.]